jgi:Fe-S cluster biogenesis protein NfuA
MSQPLSSPPSGPPPQKSGMSTIMIVLIIGGLIVLLCCGACGGCMYFGVGATNKVRDEVMRKVNTSQAVKDALGDPLTPSMPNNVKFENQQTTIDFDVTGSKGTGKVHAEGTNGPNGFEPSVIHVTAPDGKVIDVNAKTDPTDLEFDTGIDDEAK